MEINLCEINRDIVLIYLMCKEMVLDFKAMKALYIYHSNIFWNFIYTLFPAFRINIKKFCSLEKSARNILSRIKIGDSISLSKYEEVCYKSINYFLKNKYENNGELYELIDVQDYFNFSNNCMDVIFNDSRVWEKISWDTIKELICDIQQFKIGEQYFNNTSIYSYKINLEIQKGCDKKEALSNTLDIIKAELKKSTVCNE